MVGLNKRSKRILTSLNKVYPNPLKYEVLLGEIGGNHEADSIILEDLEIRELVGVSWQGNADQNGTMTHIVPSVLSITPKGRAKIRETIFTWLKDTAINNPWPVIGIVTTVVLGIIALRK